MKRKSCFVNGHCCYNCPNAQIDEFEDYYDLPAQEAGLEHIKCKDCYLNSGQCEDCLFQFDPKECPDFDTRKANESGDCS